MGFGAIDRETARLAEGIGLDFGWLDLEYDGSSSYDSTALKELHRATDVVDIEPLVRILMPELLIVRKVVDDGFQIVRISDSIGAVRGCWVSDWRRSRQARTDRRGVVRTPSATPGMRRYLGCCQTQSLTARSLGSAGGTVCWTWVVAPFPVVSVSVTSSPRRSGSNAVVSPSSGMTSFDRSS